MTVTKRNILFFLCTSVTILRGQNIDRALDRANDFYKNGGFAEAIPIYESILSKKPNSNVSRLKLANCYRILSQPDRAAPLYASIIESKEARAQDVLHYGETLMMLGKYDSAKFFYKKYTLMNPDDERGKLLLANVDKVKTLRPLFSEVTVFPFSQNSEGDDNAPALVPRGLVFASDRSQGFKLLKEKNPATGRDFTTVYFAERTGDTSFSEPREFSSRLTSLNRNTSNVTFTADSKTAFFCRNSDIPAKNNAFNMQIYAAEASDTSASGWHHVELQSFCTPETNYMYPSVSPDGKRLFFVAERGDGFGGLDIYMVTRRGNKWSKADNLGSKINTAGNEGFPFAAADGRLYFCSKGHAGYGGYDIFMTEQDSVGNWKTPRNVGAPINSPYDDISICFAKDGKSGAFTSTRGGRGDDIFFFSLKNNLFKKENQTSVTNSNTTIYAPTNGEPNVSATAEKKADAPKTEVKKGDAKPQSFSIEADPKPVGSRQPAVGGTQAASDKKPEAASRKPQDSKASRTYLEKMQQLLDDGKMKENRVFVIEGVSYDSSAAVGITPDIALELDKLSEFLLKNRRLVVEIGAHTEGSLSDDKLAKDISTRRAEQIIEYLTAQGIKAKRLLPHGYGRLRPIKDCRDGGCTPAEDAANRRVDVKIKEI